MRSVHRVLILSVVLAPAVSRAQTPSTSSSGVPCYGSTASPTPVPSLPGPNSLSPLPAPLPGTASSSLAPPPSCPPSLPTLPSTTSTPPVIAPTQPNTLGGITVQPSNPNPSVGGLPTTSP